MQELPLFLFSPVVGLVFAASALVAACLVMALRVIRRRGRLCPRCGSTTVPLVPSFPLNLMGRRVLSRWCSGCDWKGLALRPSHEHRGLDGRIHLRGGFRWGSAAPPPSPFFRWGDQLEDEESQDLSTPPPPPFQWKGRDSAPGRDESLPQLPFSWGRSRAEGPPASPAIPFRFAGDEPPPLPFHFAEEEVEEELDGELSEVEEPPRIPFRFADQDEPGRPDRAPDRIHPRLGFRWKS